MVSAGRRGGRLDDEAFRRWAIDMVVRSRPERVLLIVGGNDLAGPDFSAHHFRQLYEDLIYGVLAAGAGQVTVLPIPPRTACRPGGATVSAHRRRRRLMNLLLRRSFRRLRRRRHPSPSARSRRGRVLSAGRRPSVGGGLAYASLRNTVRRFGPVE